MIATLIYTAARAGAVASLRLTDFTHDGTQYSLRFMEKRGVQYLAGCADPRTARIYDHRQRWLTRNAVERISI